MTELYPPIEPYDQGMLDVGAENHVYWEACGNPDGKPALVVHGGPGRDAHHAIANSSIQSDIGSFFSINEDVDGVHPLRVILKRT